MRNNKPNIRVIVAMCTLMVFAYSSFYYGDHLKEPIKAILESTIPKAIIWAFIFGTVSTHRYLYGRFGQSDKGLVFSHFGSLADSIFTIATYGIASSTSLTLLKGVYIQSVFEGVEYFKDFSSLDLTSVLVVSIFLLFYSLYNIGNLFKQVVYYAGAEEAIPEKENK